MRKPESREGLRSDTNDSHGGPSGQATHARQVTGATLPPARQAPTEGLAEPPSNPVHSELVRRARRAIENRRPCHGNALDQKDQALLRLLADHGRMSWADLGREVDLSPPAVAERVRKLEEAGVIEGYAARLDPGTLGLGVLAFVWVSVDAPDAHEALLRWADERTSVQECHSLAGRHDYLLKIRCHGTADLERLVRRNLRSVPGVSTTETHVVTSTSKETTRLPTS